jgi:ABC-type hemin transport system ATPase subunit
VIVTHELNLAAEFCDQVALLHRGRFLAAGSPRDVYRREFLEAAFETPLEIQLSTRGTPRVVIHSRPELELAGLAASNAAADAGGGFFSAT